MQDLANRDAVITGAASGIGKGIATQLAKEGMKLVVADIEERPLTETEKELRAAGTHTLAIVTDVSKKDSVFALADRAFETFGTVHILCNNAGVSGGLGHVWEIPQQDWEWIMADDPTWLCSSVSICHILGLEPDYLRAGLKRWRTRTSVPELPQAA